MGPPGANHRHRAHTAHTAQEQNAHAFLGPFARQTCAMASQMPQLPGMEASTVGQAQRVAQLTPLQLDIHDAVLEIYPDRKILSIDVLAGANTNNAFLVALAPPSVSIQTGQAPEPGSDAAADKLVVRQAAADVEFILPWQCINF